MAFSHNSHKEDLQTIIIIVDVCIMLHYIAEPPNTNAMLSQTLIFSNYANVDLNP